MCVPNFFNGFFSHRSETASTYDIAQSNRYQQVQLAPLPPQYQQQQNGGRSAQPITTRRSQNNVKSFQQKQHLNPQLPQQQLQQKQQGPVKEEKQYFNGLFNKKKSIQKRTLRSKPSHGSVQQQQQPKKKHSFENNNNKHGEHQNRNNNKAKAAENNKMIKQTPSMQNDLNRGEYKAHALMNIPPPLNVNAARKSNKKVENTISISVHQKVDSDSDADILNTEKKPSPAATKRKKSEEKIEERKEEKTEEETPKVIDLVDMDSDNQIRIDESQQNE